MQLIMEKEPFTSFFQLKYRSEFYKKIMVLVIKPFFKPIKTKNWISKRGIFYYIEPNGISSFKTQSEIGWSSQKNQLNY